MEGLPFFIICFSFLSLFPNSIVAVDTIAPNQTIRDGQTLVSRSQSFELGFFSPGNSKNRYLGIWYKNIPLKTVVWVANRNNPLTDLSGILKLSQDGKIVLLNGTESVVWSTNSSKAAKNPVPQLLDTGNLVLRDENDDDLESYLWQSFDYLSDTLIPGMKFGWNLKTGWSWYLTSWKTVDDPSLGDFSYRLDLRGLPQLVLRKGGDSGNVQFRSGPWDGTRFGYGHKMKRNEVTNPMFISDESEMYFTFEINKKSVSSRFVVNQSGLLEQRTWNDRRLEWVTSWTLQQDSCDNYGLCGAYSICNINNPKHCECLTGFKPKSMEDWNSLDWSGGCVPRTPLECQPGEGFKRLKGLKLPDDSQFWVNRNMAHEECKVECLKNCSCKAYAQTEIMGCVVWFNELIDIKQYSEGGQDLYLRLAASELDSNDKEKEVAIAVVISLVSGLLILGSISWYIIWKTRKKPQEIDSNLNAQGSPEEDLELPLVDLVTVAAATNNFSSANKIGQGGFGSVYKGELPTGQEIAVKRLSKDSGQGLEEFKNEVILVARLQHRNLVGLLGCCIQGEERVLIYEYMPNKSLDLFIFGRTKGTSLDWQKRFNIIIGIAQGLLYLHRDSRLRIIHRDLKASNILLDSEMNPKISDFGIARTFVGDQTEANTKRVIGTYGYMSPEYAIDGHFSVKLDVFSFGVLVLEIVSSKRNRGFYHHEHDLNLLGHAWKLWNDGQGLKLVDVLMEDPYPVSEVLRCFQVGLLCVQTCPEDRPSMSAVVLMLSSEATMLPQPKQPGFFTERFLTENDSSSTGKTPCTPNEVTITLLGGR